MSDGGTGPNPGSDESIAQGCECPVIDNARGTGVVADGEHYGWWISSQCPLHGDAQNRSAVREEYEGRKGHE